MNLSRIWQAQTQQDTQLQHGGITLGVGLIGMILGAVLFGDAALVSGFVASLGALAFYFWRENLTSDSGWGYWKRRTELSADVLAVHKWDARRDWTIPAAVASAFFAAWTVAAFGWVLPLLLPVALGALCALDRHPHPGLTVEGLG